LVDLFTRGLCTRILINGVQSILFTIVWKYIANKKRIKLIENKDENNFNIINNKVNNFNDINIINKIV
jgi:hypothetical protein